MNAILRAEGLSKVFSEGGMLSLRQESNGVRAVDDVSFEILRGETLALVGESGCGKSTLGRLLLRLIEPTDGRVFFEGTELTALSHEKMRGMRRNVQMIFQDPYGSLSPRRSIAEIIGEPLDAFDLVRSKRERRERVADLLTQVGLPTSAMDRYPRQFSGGQRQRIGIARAISLNPGFIVADEPVSALDVSVQAQIINLMQDLQEKKGFSFLFIAHDLAVVRHIADRVAVMYLGNIVEMGTPEDILQSPAHPYTRALVSAVPQPGRPARSRIILTGDPPNPVNVPSGCPFHTRCPELRPACRSLKPELIAGGGRAVACHIVNNPSLSDGEAA